MSDMPCGICGKADYSFPVASILIAAPELDRPFTIIPDDAFAHCARCPEAMSNFADLCIESHATARAVRDSWTWMLLVYDDGEGSMITAKRNGSAALGSPPLAQA